MASAPANIGPTLRPRLLVLQDARELAALAARAVEFAGTGPSADLALAERQFERMRAILGAGGQD